MELKENVKQKLSDAVKLWADDNLIGKPAILANCIYIQLEKIFIEQTKKIEETFNKL